MEQQNRTEAIEGSSKENRLSTFLFFLLITAIVIVVTQHPNQVAAVDTQVENKQSTPAVNTQVAAIN